MSTGIQEEQQLLTQFFSKYITENKKNLIEKILNSRTRYITLVLEDIFQSQNASAVIRTCECMGLQDVHIVEDESKYSINRKVLKGADKWIDMVRYRDKKVKNIEQCFLRLRNQGYKIYAADPSPDGKSIEEVSLQSKVALVIGNELRGISNYALDHADDKITIPMYGFTESFNVSVSAAICLNTLISKLRKSDLPWQLSNDERDFIRLKWYKSCVRKPELLEQEYLRSNK